MKRRKHTITSIICAAAVMSFCTPVGVLAEDETHTLTLLDFNGDVMAQLAVPAGEKPDLDSVDTSVLSEYISVDTEKRFSSWSEVPETLTEDMTIQALYRQMTISLESAPTKTEFYDNFGRIRLTGLVVTITISTQLPEKDEDGSFRIETDKVDISSACTTSPQTLEEAFADGNYPTVNVYPPGSDKPIVSYTISYVSNLGDADMDGLITSADASYILGIYSDLATGKKVTFAAGQTKRCNVNGDGMIDAGDAALVLDYYSDAATLEMPSWEDILSQ